MSENNPKEMFIVDFSRKLNHQAIFAVRCKEAKVVNTTSGQFFKIITTDDKIIITDYNFVFFKLEKALECLKDQASKTLKWIEENHLPEVIDNDERFIND